ncbi:hypothetical protein R1sor_004891 [Riccia sorocarpa]|uniref:DUF7869 domain-containing protein n=1 Tax=Riccia sorocarpa TaxID=122646 RepID=A0ABD3HLS9_9MARC
MDHSKTILPRLSEKIKTLMGQVQPLPLKVVRILNHGHEPSVVAHVSISGLWPSDPNYTITSIAKQLRDYENYYTGSKIGDLEFRNAASHELFNALLDEEVFTKTVLMKKGKTREEYFFSSEEDDVDAFFSKMNAAQGEKNIESLPHFLAEVFHAQSSKAYPRVIQEVADYKQHVENFVVHLSGQSSPVAFRFNMRDNIPSYQVQEKYGGPWVPVHGRSAWKRSEPDSDLNFSVILPPKQNPAAKCPRSPHPKKGEIISFIKNYMSYNDELQKKTDPTCDIYLQDQCLVKYWRRISKILEKGWEEKDGVELKE